MFCKHCQVAYKTDVKAFLGRQNRQGEKTKMKKNTNISKRTKTGVLQRILTLFHRHYSLERNKKICGNLF